MYCLKLDTDTLSGMSKTIGPVDEAAAIKEFQKKFKDKTGLTWDDRKETPKGGKKCKFLNHKSRALILFPPRYVSLVSY
jgi:hypothetical protein